jgi:hypothetical protein
MAKKKRKAQQDKQLSKKTLYGKQKIQQNELLCNQSIDELTCFCYIEQTYSLEILKTMFN